VPVLAGSAAYALGEAMQFPVGISQKPRSAPAFYAVIASATVLGVALNFVWANPMRALLFAAVVNGVIAVPIMAMTMALSMNPRAMGEFVLPPRLAVLGWLATAVMAAAALGMFATLGR
jgi:Mn2+/Fe2+ NRAMP family transporter